MKSLPFFSICIETKNRFSTIERTLTSVLNQDCRDFELILVDNNSTDNTLGKINEFFNSKVFKDKPFNYLIKNSNVLGLENWNKPIQFASGKYIAYLEGDDSYLENHLSYAKEVLTNKKNIGLYFAQSVGKKRTKLIDTVDLSKCEYLDELLQSAPAPSTIIFKRVISDKIIFFNVKDYKYAPEIDLYLKIYSFGCKIFYSKNVSIKRDVEKIPKPSKSNLRFHDRNVLINRWGKYFECKNIHDLRKKNYKLFFIILINEYANNEKNWKKLWRNLKINLKEFNYITYLRYCIIKFFLHFLIYFKLFEIVKYIRRIFKKN